MGRALNLWYFCTTEILFINSEQQKRSYMLRVSGLHGLSSPPLHLQYRDTSGEDRAPRDMMVLPSEWAPSTACNSEKGEEDKGGYVHSFFQIWWLHIQHTIHIYRTNRTELYTPHIAETFARAQNTFSGSIPLPCSQEVEEKIFTKFELNTHGLMFLKDSTSSMQFVPPTCKVVALYLQRSSPWAAVQTAACTLVASTSNWAPPTRSYPAHYM